jgi:Right handed beta helix region
LTSRRGPAAIGLLAALAGGCKGETHYIGTECVPSGTADDLQKVLDVQSTVLLCQRAVISLDKSITVYGGLTLLTAGAPTDPAAMATIILGPDYPDGMGTAVRGAGRDIHISAVRFDGNRRVLGWRPSQIPLELGPGGGYTVDHCVFADSAGWTHLHLLESCDVATITNNVVESSARPHGDQGQWTDGLSISCAHALIAENQINDVSSVGIVYFGGPGSTIRDNVITESVTSAFSGINVGDAVVPDNTGVVVDGNHVVAKSPRYFSEGLNAGLHVIGKTATVSGVSFTNNKIEGMFRYGLAVDGCLDCTVTGNDVSGYHPLPPLPPPCPWSAPYVAAATAMHASGTLQPGFVDGKIDGCGGEAEVLGPTFRNYAGDVPYPDYLAFEVQVFSQRMEQKLDATALLEADWDTIEARAKAICPAGATASDLEAVWRRLTAAQYGGATHLPPADADAKVRADLTAAPAGTPCSPPAP